MKSINTLLTKEDIKKAIDRVSKVPLLNDLKENFITLDNLNGIVLSDYAEKQAVLRWLSSVNIWDIAREIYGKSIFVDGDVKQFVKAMRNLQQLLGKEVDNV